MIFINEKITRNILVILLIIIVFLGLVSCNFSKNLKSNLLNKTNATETTKTNESTENNGEEGTTIEGKGNSELFNTIEDALKHPATKETLENSMPKDVKISAKGNDLTYVIKVDGLNKSKEVTEQLKKELAKNKSSFENVANTLLGSINGKEMNMIIKYADSKGETVYEHKFNFKK